MSQPVDDYIKGIHKRFDFYANWLPNAPRALGDVGVLSGKKFERVTTLAKLGVSFETRAGVPGEDFAHTSGESVELRVKVSGEALPGSTLELGKAGASVSFTDSGAFVFQASAPAQDEIEDLHALERALLRHEDWQPEWCVVTRLVRAGRLTVLVSESSNASVDIEAAADLKTSAVSLADAEVGLEVKHQKGQVTSVLSAVGTTPLLGLSRMRKSWVDWLLSRDPHLGRASLDGDPPPQEPVLEDVQPEE